MDLEQLAEGIRIGRLIQQAADLVRNDVVLKQNERQFLEQARRLDPEVNKDHYYLVIAWVLSERFQHSNLYTKLTTYDWVLHDVNKLVDAFANDIAGTHIPN
jgi:CRISPR/Cas system-associated endonuclease Cas3-HD